MPSKTAVEVVVKAKQAVKEPSVTNSVKATAENAASRMAHFLKNPKIGGLDVSSESCWLSA